MEFLRPAGAWQGGNYLNSSLIFILVVPFIEELLKFGAVMAVGFPSKKFNQIIDGTIYAVAVSLGFVMIENFFYFAEFYSRGTAYLVEGMILRTFSSTFLHTLSTGWLGYWIGRAKFDKTRRLKFLLVGFFFAVMIHAAFNFFLLTSSYFFVIFTLLITADLLFVRLRAHKTQIIWKKNRAKR